MWTIAARQVSSRILCMACVLIAAPAAPAPLHVEWAAGRLSISAEHVPLAQLLHEVARRARRWRMRTRQ
jgi:hypothetical protein